MTPDEETIITLPVKASVQYDASASIVFGNQAQALLAGARDYQIDSPTLLAMAAADLQRVKDLQKKVEDTRTSITGPMLKAKTAVDLLFKAPAGYLDQAEAVLKGAILTYTKEQDRLAAEAKRIADEAAARERERLADIERQAQAAADDARRQADALAQAAIDAAAQGDLERAEQLRIESEAHASDAEVAEGNAQAAMTEAAVTSIAPAFSAPTKPAGLGTRTNYIAEVDDLMLLVIAVAAGGAPLECLQANTTFIGQQARAFKKVGRLYAGVTVRAEANLSVRRT